MLPIRSRLGGNRRAGASIATRARLQIPIHCLPVESHDAHSGGTRLRTEPPSRALQPPTWLMEGLVPLPHSTDMAHREVYIAPAFLHGPAAALRNPCCNRPQARLHSLRYTPSKLPPQALSHCNYACSARRVSRTHRLLNRACTAQVFRRLPSRSLAVILGVFLHPAKPLVQPQTMQAHPRTEI
ncbi:hypothetical protein C8Q79DRAFT_775101 [Trametes meyenii]|nr:hypothetical protein C8Q79DRAFT_775101 [Trametes meyenii]